MTPETALYVWSETIPNWLMAASAAAALGTFIVRRTDRRERQQLADSEVRIGVQARWMKTSEADGDAKWGVLVENSLPSPVHTVELICPGNNYSTDNRIRIPSIPARTKLFVESRQGEYGAWQFARALQTSEEPVTFLTQGKKFDVHQVQFVYLGKAYAHDGTGVAASA